MIATIKMEPSALERSTLENLAAHLATYTEWQVNATITLVPYDLINCFREGELYTRATYSLSKCDHEMFVHIDFKDSIEIYVIHKLDRRNVVRRLYTVGTHDSLALFHVITTELSGLLHGT